MSENGKNMEKQKESLRDKCLIEEICDFLNRKDEGQKK